jgi:plastocyanin
MFLVLSWFVAFSEGIALSETITGKVAIEGQAKASNVVVYLKGVDGNFFVPMKRPEMNHLNLAFSPLVLPVLKGITVNFPNSDPVFHSAFSTSPSNPFELGVYGEGSEKSQKFVNAGEVEIFCHIHPYMRAFILVLENPYFTITDGDGRYTLTGVPKGSYVIKAWQGFLRATGTKTVIIDGEQKVTVDLVLHPQKVAGDP